MKIPIMKSITAACAFCVSANLIPTAWADEQTAPARPESTYTGMVVSVDPQSHVLTVKGWVFSKKSFNLGENCAYELPGKTPATIGDLRSGQKVTVTYQDAQGVLIADRVEQKPLQMEGMVTAIDAGQRKLTLGSGRHVEIGNDCKVVLRNSKTGSFSDIQVGNHVTVTYEKPGDVLVAREIAQTSQVFTGALTAIDLEERTVKAKSTFAAKKFFLADNCAIVINGKTDGKLAGLKINDQLNFSYDEINGINVVNRIAPAGEETNADSLAKSSH